MQLQCGIALKFAGVLDNLLCRLPKAIGGELQGVQYIRDVADADALVDSFVSETSHSPLCKVLF